MLLLLLLLPLASASCEFAHSARQAPQDLNTSKPFQRRLLSCVQETQRADNLVKAQRQQRIQLRPWIRNQQLTSIASVCLVDNAIQLR